MFAARSRSGRKEKYFEGDIVMTKSIEEMIENRKRGAASANSRHNWPFNPGNGKYEIPYVIDRGKLTCKSHLCFGYNNTAVRAIG